MDVGMYCTYYFLFDYTEPSLEKYLAINILSASKAVSTSTKSYSSIKNQIARSVF